MIMKAVTFLLVTMIMTLAATGPARAQPAGDVYGQPITSVSVMMNMARILRIPTSAATVIVGNPGIADVTIQDPRTLILTGKSYGRTNLVALDISGEAIADMIIEVTRSQTEVLTVYLGAARTTLACSPECQPIILVGDDVGYTGNTIASAQIVAGAAQ